MAHRRRTHEQPLPKQGQDDVISQVIKDWEVRAGFGSDAELKEIIQEVKNRLAVGIEAYGLPLQTRNGRSALRDELEEILDAVNYEKQHLLEQGHKYSNRLWVLMAQAESVMRDIMSTR